jgi:hypothetical protein
MRIVLGHQKPKVRPAVGSACGNRLPHAHLLRAVVTCNYSDPQSNFCFLYEHWQAAGREHAGIILVPQHQISSRTHRWGVRDRLLKFLNSYPAEELRNQLWWLPQD